MGFSRAFREPLSQAEAGGICSQTWGVTEKPKTSVKRRWHGWILAHHKHPCQLAAANQENWEREEGQPPLHPPTSIPAAPEDQAHVKAKSTPTKNLFFPKKKHRGKAQQQLVWYSTCNWSSPRRCTEGKIEINQQTMRINSFFTALERKAAC